MDQSHPYFSNNDSTLCCWNAILRNVIVDMYKINRSSVSCWGMVLASPKFCFRKYSWIGRILVFICGNYNFIIRLENLARKKVQDESPNNLLGILSSKHNPSYWILYLHLCLSIIIHCILAKDQRLCNDRYSGDRLFFDIYLQFLQSEQIGTRLI